MGSWTGGASGLAAAGALTGAAVSGGLFYRLFAGDRRVARADAAFAEALGVPLLAAVPDMLTGRERHELARGRRTRMLATATALALLAVVAAWALRGFLAVAWGS